MLYEVITWALQNGVTIRHWAAPKTILSEDHQLTGMTFAITRDENGKLVETGETFTLSADMVLKAIGQSYLPEAAGQEIRITSYNVCYTKLLRISNPSPLVRYW